MPDILGQTCTGPIPAPGIIARVFRPSRLSILALVLPLAACGGHTSHHAAASAPAATASKDGDCAVQPCSLPPVSLGTAVMVKSAEPEGEAPVGAPQMQITAARVIDPAKTKDTTLPPDAGTRYVAVQYVFHNPTGQPYKTAEDSAAYVVDDQGKRYGYKFTFLKVRTLATIDVQPGGTQTGYVSFQVPKTAKLAKAQWTMDLGVGQTGQWNLR